MCNKMLLRCLLIALMNAVSWCPMASAQGDVAAVSLLRFSGRANAELANTRGIMKLDQPFTVEVWCRPSSTFAREQNIAGDEGWKNLGENVVITRECGWVLRTGPIVDGGKRTIDFTLGTTGDANTPVWTRIETAPLKLDDAWHHIAACRSADMIRIFVDGLLAAERRLTGLTFVASPTNTYLGVRRGTFLDRQFFGDVGGFRMSSMARYEKAFFPPPFLNADAGTLFALDCDGKDPRAVLGRPEVKNVNLKGKGAPRFENMGNKAKALAVEWIEVPTPAYGPRSPRLEAKEPPPKLPDDPA